MAQTVFVYTGHADRQDITSDSLNDVLHQLSAVGIDPDPAVALHRLGHVAEIGLGVLLSVLPFHGALLHLRVEVVKPAPGRELDAQEGLAIFDSQRQLVIRAIVTAADDLHILLCAQASLHGILQGIPGLHYLRAQLAKCLHG